MNKELIDFIELCLSDGILTKKEREVIFRKSDEFGVPEDECEIILDGMINKNQIKLQDEKVSDEAKILVKDVKSEESDYSYLTLDYQVVKKLNSILNLINERLKYIDENPQLVNDKFIEWLKNLNSTYLKDKSLKNEIVNFKFIKGSRYDGVDVIGEFIGFNKKTYIFTPKYYVELSQEPIKNFWGTVTGYKTKYENKKLLDEINVFDEKQSKIFNYLLMSFSKDINEFHFNDIVHNQILKVDNDKLFEVLGQIKSPDTEAVFKVTNEIEKLLNDLTGFFNKLGVPYKESSFIYHNVFSPYTVPYFNVKPYGVNEDFYFQLEVLLNKIKFIVSVISLRNDLVTSVIKSDYNRISFLKVKLDQMGLLMNYYQNQSLNKLEQQNQILINGFNQISNVLNEVVSKLEVLNNISNNLEKIDETISFGNLLTGIQTYQLYKINKNTKIE